MHSQNQALHIGQPERWLRRRCAAIRFLGSHNARIMAGGASARAAMCTQFADGREIENGHYCVFVGLFTKLSSISLSAFGLNSIAPLV